MSQAFSQYLEIIRSNIFVKLRAATVLALYSADKTVKSWICHKDDGGLAYQTFRATCVREYVPVPPFSPLWELC